MKKVNTILLIYSKTACKEYCLPNIDNSDYQIVLDKKSFGIGRDLHVKLEVIKKCWSFQRDTEYEIIQEQEIFYGQELKGGMLLQLHTLDGERLAIVVVETANHLKCPKKFFVSNNQVITIGKDSNNTIKYEFNGLISRRHAQLTINLNSCVVEDLSKNGVFWNNRRINQVHTLKFGESITMYGLQIIYLGNVLAVSGLAEFVVDEQLSPFVNEEVTDKIGVKEKEENPFFHRSPRTIEELFEDEIKIVDPPNSKKEKEKSLLLRIGPSITMVIPTSVGCVMAMYLGGGNSGLMRLIGVIMVVCSAVVATIWTLLNINREKKQEIFDENERKEQYINYMKEMDAQINEKYQANIRILNERYISAQQCCELNTDNPILWNRNTQHEDFLFVRLGMGNMPFQVKITVPDRKYNYKKDLLTDIADGIQEKYEMLYDVPVGIDLLEKQLVGVVGGPNKKGAMQVVMNMIAQIAANNCYTDVKIAFVGNGKEKVLEAAKWLPHTWSDDNHFRFLASNKEEAGDVFYELVNYFRLLDEKKDGKDKKQPHYILILEDWDWIEGETIQKYIFEDYDKLTTIMMADNYYELPNECVDIIENDSEFCGYYNLANRATESQEIRFDSVNQAQLDAFSRYLSGVQVKSNSASGEIPNSLEFLEMYNVKDCASLGVLERWIKNRNYENMRAIIGKRTGGKPCYLDIHEKFHGPHGLIAGTTGSGKSEFLQTYLLSLAIEFSPEDVGFFIIDFKGGGMANVFSKLPHMLGNISNLSGNQIERAMVSIKSENQRRQRLFNECGVNNINAYTALYKNGEVTEPIPHLLIVIDEFAELKKEEPEFMKEIISVAQVGRSLGVHLILATQKPNGTVDSNIWSNTKFRVCLRVQSKQDSKDMIQKPDAAYLTQAGRAYLQVGADEIYDQFQSAWSGAAYDEDSKSASENSVTMINDNGTNAIVGNHERIRTKEKMRRRWLKSLLVMSENVIAEMDTSVYELKRNEEIMNQYVMCMMKRFEEQKIDYTDSYYNRSRLENLIKLCDINEVSLDESVDYILEKAQKEKLRLPELKERTQLDVIVDYLAELANNHGYQKQHQLWLPVLPDKIYLSQLNRWKKSPDDYRWAETENEWSLQVPIGIYDDPARQFQGDVVVDFEKDGHCALYGATVTGKSTFVQSLVYGLISKYSPEHLNLYLLDFSSQLLSVFKDAPHVGGIMDEQNLSRVDKFFYMLTEVLAERKRVLKGGNFIQYVKIKKEKLPAIVIVIDNYSGFRDKTKDKHQEFILKLLRESAAYGIFMFFTSVGISTTDISYKMAANINKNYSLELTDQSTYTEAFGGAKMKIKPESGVKGRGLVNIHGDILEFQTALACEAKDDYERFEIIQATCEKMQQSYHGTKARTIPEIPANAKLDDLFANEEFDALIKQGNKIPFGFNASNAKLAYVNLTKTFCYLISGRKKCGKTNVMKLLLNSMSKVSGDIHVIDTKSFELKKCAQQVGAKYYVEYEDMYRFFEGLIPVIQERNKLKRQLLSEGMDEEEIYNRMKEEKAIMIMISDLANFLEKAYSDENEIGSMGAFLENITEKGSQLNMYFFAVVDNNSQAALSRNQTFVNMKEYQTGMHLGGNLNAQRIFNFINVSYKESNVLEKAGNGYMSSFDEPDMGEKIILPLVK